MSPSVHEYLVPQIPLDSQQSYLAIVLLFSNQLPYDIQSTLRVNGDLVSVRDTRKLCNSQQVLDTTARLHLEVLLKRHFHQVRKHQTESTEPKAPDWTAKAPVVSKLPAIMPVFMNPFHKHDVSEFEGVLIPFGDADRHHAVIAAHDEKLGTKDGKPVEAEEGDASATYSAYSIEGLREEIDADLAASGHDTAYDRMFEIWSRSDRGLPRPGVRFI